MARAITAGELTALRADGYWSELYLAIYNPAAGFTARLNQVFDSSVSGVYDRITQITYDGSSGTAYAGQMLYVGSVAGGYDKGTVRIRSTGTNTLYIAETSDIQWADNDYLTVVDDIALWARHPSQFGDTVYMDYDVEYSDQHVKYNPVPVLGHDPVFWLPTDGSVTWTPDASTSWCPNSSADSYQWYASGTSATSDMDTATPTMTWAVTGQYSVSCVITSGLGATFTGHRHVFIYDAAHMPVSQFTLGACRGSYDSGGWSFDITLYAEAARSSIRDRARVILFARDHYSGTLVSYGPYADDTENIVCSGWVDGESIVWNPTLGTVSFTVQGPAFWLGKISTFPITLKHVSGTPATWGEISNLTVDKALWHLVMWRSTAAACMDITPTGDTRLVKIIDAAASNLWDQISVIAEQSILAHPVCDRYGHLYVEIDTQYLAADDRASIPTVMAITSADWQDAITINRTATSKTSAVDLAATMFDGVDAYDIRSRSPGIMFKRFGNVTAIDRIQVSDQDKANTIAGAIMALENNEYPSVDVDLAMNNRMIDVAPRQYVTLTIATADTTRGIAFTDKKFIAREVSLEHDAGTGALTTALTLEAETLPDIAVMITPAQPPVDNTIDEPVEPPWDPTDDPGTYPPTDDTTDDPPSTGGDCVEVLTSKTNGPLTVWGLSGLLDRTTFRTRTATLAAWLRSAWHSHKTIWAVQALFQEYDETTATWINVTPDQPWFRLDVLKKNRVVATSAHDPILLQYYQTGKFSNSAAVEFDAIRITFVEDEGFIEWPGLEQSVFLDAFPAVAALSSLGHGKSYTLSTTHNGSLSVTGTYDVEQWTFISQAEFYFKLAWREDLVEHFPFTALSPTLLRINCTIDGTPNFDESQEQDPYGTKGTLPMMGYERATAPGPYNSLPLASTTHFEYSTIMSYTDPGNDWIGIEACIFYPPHNGLYPPYKPEVFCTGVCKVTVGLAKDVIRLRRVMVQQVMLWNICTIEAEL